MNVKGTRSHENPSTNLVASTTENSADTIASNPTNLTTDLSTNTIGIQAPLGNIQGELADTPAIRERGLSGRVSMNSNQGMLFVFDRPGVYGFWMKDMNFPLDMVWIDRDHKVVSINSDVATSTYPDAIFPACLPPACAVREGTAGNILYVLELNAGKAKDFGIVTGTVLGFELK